jgi:hypothetical protein
MKLVKKINSLELEGGTSKRTGRNGTNFVG